MTGRKLDELFKYVREVYQNMTKRISTGQLNKFIEKTMYKVHPPMLRGKRLRIDDMSQVDQQPPRFIFFVNQIDLLGESYKKYLVNQFRKEYQYTGVPLSFFLKGKKRGDNKKGSIKAPQFLDEPLLFEDENVGSHL